MVAEITDHNWKKGDKCRVALDTGKFDTEGKRVYEESDGFKWTRVEKGIGYEMNLPAGKKPDGVT